jgi:hypothetical protein
MDSSDWAVLCYGGGVMTTALAYLLLHFLVWRHGYKPKQADSNPSTGLAAAAHAGSGPCSGDIRKEPTTPVYWPYSGGHGQRRLHSRRRSTGPRFRHSISLLLKRGRRR